MMDNKLQLQHLTTRLLSLRKEDQQFWPWLGELAGKPADLKQANKFL
jgi:hypothetical protein